MELLKRREIENKIGVCLRGTEKTHGFEYSAGGITFV